MVRRRGDRPSPRALVVGLLAVALVLPAQASAAAPPEAAADRSSRRSEPSPAFVPGELLVRFEYGTSVSTRRSFRAQNALKRLEGLPLSGLERLKVSAPGSIPALAERLSRHPAIRFAEPNYIVHALDAPLPSDPEFDDLWGLHNTGQTVGPTTGTNDADIDAPEGWELGLGTDQASDVVVGVIDTGVDITHPDLEGQIWTNTDEIPDNGIDDDDNDFIDDVHGWDFAHDDATVFDPSDLDDHGTHVAGTIAATMNNNTDVAGVSQAQIMPLKFLGEGGTGSTSDAVKAIDYAIDNDADITSNSWGGGGASGALRDAIQRANVAGQLFVAAAGNDGTNNDATPRYPATFNLDNIVSVAATDNRDELASFSNYGSTTVDLGAPGRAVLSTVPSFGKAVLAGPDFEDGPAYRSALHTFGLEGVPDPGERQALLGAALAWMEIDTDDPILLVKDDRRSSSSFSSAYQGALVALGHTLGAGGNVSEYSTGTTCANGPPPATLAAHRAVIWFTGSTLTCTLRSTDRTRLTSYLEDAPGRNLLLFGQDIGYDLTDDGSETSLFLEETLRTDYLADFDENFNLTGASGTPYEGVGAITLDERDVGAGQFYSSAISERNGAVTGLRTGGTALFSGTSMATPHVTGAAAQVIAGFPDFDHLDVKQRLMETGDPIEALTGRTVSGNRLNLAAALNTEVSPPVTEIAGPTQNQTLPRAPSLAIGGIAEDDAGVTEVLVAIRDAAGEYWDGDGFRAGAPIWWLAELDPSEGGSEVEWSFIWAPLPPADWEEFTVLARARDVAGTLGLPDAVDVTLDNVAPHDIQAMTGGRYQTDASFTVSWEAGDGSAGASPLEFDLERRISRAGRGWGSWAPWDAAQGTEATNAGFTGTPGRTHCFRATARDEAGNAGTGPKACTAVPLNDTQLQHRGSWETSSGQAGYYLDSFSRSTQKRAKLVLDGVRARRLALVATRCPTCGRILVRWQGRTVRGIDLAAGTVQRTAVISLATFSRVRTGKLVLIVASSGRPVIVEGLGISRT